MFLLNNFIYRPIPMYVSSFKLTKKSVDLNLDSIPLNDKTIIENCAESS